MQRAVVVGSGDWLGGFWEGWLRILIVNGQKH